MARVIILYVGVAVAIVAAFMAGYYLQEYYLGMENRMLKSELEKLRIENEALRAELSQVRSKLASITLENDDLKASISSLERRVDELLSSLEEKENEVSSLLSRLSEEEEQVSSLTQTLEKIRNSVSMLKKDRELLVVLSEGIPNTREEAERFWNDTRKLVERIEPNLVPTIDKILFYLDYYFDWLESVPQTEDPQAFCDWIFSYTVEADQYNRAIQEFRSEAYQIVLSHVNQVLLEVEEA